MAKRKPGAQGKKGRSSKKLVTSEEINTFIVRHAHEEDNWASLRRRILRELKVELSHTAVVQRAHALCVKTKGKKLNFSSASFKVVDPHTVKPEGALAQEVLATIKRKRASVLTVEDVANVLVTSPAKVREALKELRETGFNVSLAEGMIELNRDVPKAPPIKIDRKMLDGQKFRFLATGDNHIGNKHQRLDVLEALFDVAEAEGITTVFNTGNMIDGDHNFNKHEVLCRGLDAQAAYLAEVWPKRKGITTHFVTGDDHEGWYANREGVDVGFYIQQKFESVGRNDFQYLGHVEADVLLPGKSHRSVMRVIHAGGGSAYATSYSTQKIVESYQGGEKPRILLVGHYHKANFDYSREVYTIQTGCTCDQTTFMRKKKLQAHVGGWIIEVTIAPDGTVIRVRQEWIPFYDKGVYDKAWKAARFSNDDAGRRLYAPR